MSEGSQTTQQRLAAVRAAFAELAACQTSTDVARTTERVLRDWVGARDSQLLRGTQYERESGNTASVGTAVVGVPLRVGDEWIGVVALRGLQTDVVEREHGPWLAVIADYAAATLRGREVAEHQQAALEELERLDRTKSDFVSIVSHEFRTPLTGIQGFSEMMSEEDLTYEEMKEYAGDINKDAKRLNRLITELLDLDRMESGRMQLTLEPVDVNELLIEVAALIRPTLSAHVMAFELDPAAPHVRADRDKLTQVVTNLLNNAVKYSPSGGEIRLSSQSEGGWVRVSVRDHGMGIPDDQLETVFERYTRVQSTARYVQGTGLGLPIVRQIAQMHGGRASVESVIGTGSLFWVELPIDGPVRAVR